MSNTKEDISRLQERANAGDASAQNSLGCAYHNADGVPRDYAKAKEWYLKAASQKESYAQSNLGILYLYGLGVKADIGMACYWFEKSARQGNSTALFRLGELYEEGKDVNKNLAYAYRLFGEAVKQGNKKAIAKLSSMEKEYDKNLDIRAISCPVISKNIFRTLGVFANSSTREITSHKSRIQTFQKVGKDIHFGIDDIIKGVYPDIYSRELNLFFDDNVLEMPLDKLHPLIMDKRARLHVLAQTEIYSKYIRRENIDEENLSLEERQILREIKDIKKELQKLQFSYDSKRHDLMKPCRKSEDIDKASSKIEDDREKLRHAMFWFACSCSTDEEALSLIKNSQSKDAFSLLSKSENYSSMLNCAVLSFLKGNDDDFIERITNLIHIEKYRIDFLKAVCGSNCIVSENDLSHLLVDTLLEVLPHVNWMEIFRHNAYNDDIEYLEDCLVKMPIHNLEKEINNAKAVPVSGGSVAYHSA